MKKEITLTTNTTNAELQSFTSSILKTIKAPVVWLSRYYSNVLERKISTRQTLLFINAQTAFVFMAFPSDCSLLVRVLCCGWFLHAVLMCKNALKTKGE